MIQQAHGRESFTPSTGLPPVDGVLYGRVPQIEAQQHDASQIVLSRMQTLGDEDMTFALLDGSQWDTLVLSRGTGRQITGKVAGKAFEVRPHNNMRASFVPHGIDISIEFVANQTSRNLLFPLGYLKAMLADENHRDFPAVISQTDERLMHLMQLVEMEMHNPGFATRLMFEGLARAIAAIVNNFDPAPANADAERIYLTPAKLRRVTDFIEANLEANIGLEDIARVAELSLFHFSRVFKLATGSTPYHYIHNRRLERSRALLMQGDLSLAELALVCGFANQSHFTAAFTKAVGVSPGRFRRQSS